MELQKHITDERTGISYTLYGDYYLPDLNSPEQTEYEIGRFGIAHMHFIEQNRKALYQALLTSCRLNQYLHKVDESCRTAYELMMKDFVSDEGISENLRTTDRTEWIRRINRAKSRAEEIVFREFVYI